MSSHFGSFVAAPHPLQTFDSAVEAAGTTASKGTPRENIATLASDNIGNTMSCGAAGSRAGATTHKRTDACRPLAIRDLQTNAGQPRSPDTDASLTVMVCLPCWPLECRWRSHAVSTKTLCTAATSRAQPIHRTACWRATHMIDQTDIKFLNARQECCACRERHVCAGMLIGCAGQRRTLNNSQ